FIPPIKRVHNSLSHGALWKYTSCFEFIGQPFAKGIDHRQRFLQPEFFSFAGAQVPFSCIRFHLVERLYKAQSYRSPVFVIVKRIVELPASMCPATYMGHTFAHADFIINGITIRLQIPLEPLQYMRRSSGATPGLVVE